MTSVKIWIVGTVNKTLKVFTFKTAVCDRSIEFIYSIHHWHEKFARVWSQKLGGVIKTFTIYPTEVFEEDTKNLEKILLLLGLERNNCQKKKSI